MLDTTFSTKASTFKISFEENNTETEDFFNFKLMNINMCKLHKNVEKYLTSNSKKQIKN